MTGALVPVHITALASATSLDVTGPVDGAYAPVTAGADAAFQLQYAEGDLPVGSRQ